MLASRPSYWRLFILRGGAPCLWRRLHPAVLWTLWSSAFFPAHCKPRRLWFFAHLHYLTGFGLQWGDSWSSLSIDHINLVHPSTAAYHHRLLVLSQWYRYCGWRPSWLWNRKCTSCPLLFSRLSSRVAHQIEGVLLSLRYEFLVRTLVDRLSTPSS